MTNQEFIESIRLEGEEWRDVPGWEGYYAASSEGRLISLGRFKTYKNRGGHAVEPFLMKQTKTPCNGILYYYVTVCRDGHKYRRGVHTLVARAFLLNPHNYSDVDHINRNGLDNRVENLRWASRSMNMLNKNTRPILSQAQRQKSMRPVWKPVIALKDGTESARYDSITEAAKNGYSESCIIEVCKGRSHSHCGLIWMYLSDYEKLQVSMSKNSKSVPNG